MQFQIPQFIETEDKIIGPLSIRQFIYACATIGSVMLLYFVLQTWLWLIFSALILSVGGSFAFVTVNGQSFSKIVFYAAQFYWKPQTYVWQPEHPDMPRTEATTRASGFSLERLVAGAALKRAARYVQTGSVSQEEKPATPVTQPKEQYQIFRAVGGERQAAKRVDYR